MTALTPSPLSHRAVREYAERVATHHGAVPEHGGPTDLALLLRNLGGSIRVADSLVDPRLLRIDRRGAFEVIHQPLTSSRRRRFHTARALGHYFVHYLLPGNGGAMLLSDPTEHPAGVQANIFASALLMPSSTFIPAHERLRGDHLELSHLYDVSPRAALARIGALGLDA